MTTVLTDWAREQLGHVFADASLIQRAMTHSSRGVENYERLEFLGDRVLGFVVATLLIEHFPDESEGQLAVRFAALVDRTTCAEVAQAIGVAKLLSLDVSARAAGVHLSDNVLGDVCEALIGSLYIDGGIDAARRFIVAHWSPLLRKRTRAQKDSKSRLQEWAQSRALPIPSYEVIWRDGPDHQPLFRVRVTLRDIEPVEATGASKQEAEKLAAAAMLERVGA